METKELNVLLKDAIMYDKTSVIAYNQITHIVDVEVLNKEHNMLINLLKNGFFDGLIDAGFIAPRCIKAAKEFVQKINSGAKSGECNIFVKDGTDKPFYWVRFTFVSNKSTLAEPLTIITIKNKDDEFNKKLINKFYKKEITNGVCKGNSYFVVNLDDETIYNSYGNLAIKTKNFKEQINYIASMCDENAQQVRSALSKDNLLKQSDNNKVVELLNVLIHNIGGMSKWFKVSAIYIKHPLNNVNFVQIVFWDIDADYREAEDIKYNATHDELTDLLNKNTFTSMAVEKIDKLHHNFWKALIFVDVDDFKKINDNLGHIIGDRVLRGVAMGIKKSFRKNDIIGRVGGDEFMILFSVPNLYTLYTRLNLIKENIKQTEQIENISASIGVVMFFDKDNDFEGLYYQADKAMYTAKQKGKDCFYVVDQYNNAYLNDALLNMNNKKIAPIMKLKANNYLFAHYNDDKIIVDYITPNLQPILFDEKSINEFENLSKVLSKKDFEQLNNLISTSTNNQDILMETIKIKGLDYNVFISNVNNKIITAFQPKESC